jgi:hypothetical protein
VKSAYSLGSGKDHCVRCVCCCVKLVVCFELVVGVLLCNLIRIWLGEELRFYTVVSEAPSTGVADFAFYGV